MFIYKYALERKIYNPIQKDQVIFLKTAAVTNNKYTLVEVELADGGGVGLHYHKTYTEKFNCLEGEVEIQVGKKIVVLQPGQSLQQCQRLTIYSETEVANPVNFW